MYQPLHRNYWGPKNKEILHGWLRTQRHSQSPCTHFPPRSSQSVSPAPWAWAHARSRTIYFWLYSFLSIPVLTSPWPSNIAIPRRVNLLQRRHVSDNCPPIQLGLGYSPNETVNTDFNAIDLSNETIINEPLFTSEPALNALLDEHIGSLIKIPYEEEYAVVEVLDRKRTNHMTIVL